MGRRIRRVRVVRRGRCKDKTNRNVGGKLTDTQTKERAFLASCLEKSNLEKSNLEKEEEYSKNIHNGWRNSFLDPTHIRLIDVTCNPISSNPGEPQIPFSSQRRAMNCFGESLRS